MSISVAGCNKRSTSEAHKDSEMNISAVTPIEHIKLRKVRKYIPITQLPSLLIMAVPRRKEVHKFLRKIVKFHLFSNLRIEISSWN
jgi:hypothetical protein